MSEGEVAHALKLSSADLAKLPRQTVSAKEHDGKTATFEGVALVEILRLAGVGWEKSCVGRVSLYISLWMRQTDTEQYLRCRNLIQHLRIRSSFWQIVVMEKLCQRQRDSGELSFRVRRDRRGGYVRLSRLRYGAHKSPATLLK